MSVLLRRNTQQQPQDQAFSKLIFKGPKLLLDKVKGPERLLRSKSLFLNVFTTYTPKETATVCRRLFACELKRRQRSQMKPNARCVVL